MTSTSAAAIPDRNKSTQMRTRISINWERRPDTECEIIQGDRPKIRYHMITRGAIVNCAERRTRRHCAASCCSTFSTKWLLLPRARGGGVRETGVHRAVVAPHAEVVDPIRGQAA